jgi:hypothetical protein
MTRKSDFEDALSIGTKLWDEARGIVERTLSENDMKTAERIAAAIIRPRGKSDLEAVATDAAVHGVAIERVWLDEAGDVSRERIPPREFLGGARYFAVKGSGSNHCCFDGSVYDRKDEIRGADGNFISFGIVCECFDMETAERIATALNASIEAPVGEGWDG